MSEHPWDVDDCGTPTCRVCGTGPTREQTDAEALALMHAHLNPRPRRTE